VEDRVEAFIAADATFYDVLHSSKAETGNFSLGVRELPAGWGREERDDWVVMRRPETVLPVQGWKIHASSCMDNAERVLETVWNYCVPRNISFKFLRSQGALLGRVSKYAARGFSGKLVTIYPADDAACELILNELGELLDGEPNPYILSDLRWGKGPLYVRYGAFANRFCVADNGRIVGAIEDDSGTLVPDRRGPVFYVPPWIQLPEFLKPHLEARNSVTMEGVPYAIDRVVHFSNGGGIYVARRTNGGDEEVVLKEARPYSGLDANGEDAVRRLEREFHLMCRFEGVPGVPRAYEMFDVGEHRFLAMEFIDGRPLSREIVRRYPLIQPDATPEDYQEFTDWALKIYDQVEAAIAAIHERGYVYGDLHLFNVLVREDDSIGLLDFEVTMPIDEATRPGLANQGFSAPRGTTGVDIDRYALGCLRLALFLPMTNVVWLDRGKAHHFARIILEHFPVPEDFLARAIEAIDPPAVVIPNIRPWPECRDDLATAILASATPERSDRLFPGDIRQFSAGGGISLAYGAAGVLYALAATGAGRFPEHDRWLLDRVARPEGGTPLGFWDGLHGAVYVLDFLGYQEEAHDLLKVCLAEDWTSLGLDLHSGLAGIGLNLLHLADSTGDASLREAGLRAASLVAQRLGDESSVPETSGRDNPLAGLLRGSSGPALLLMRAFDETGDAELLDRAATAIRMDLKRSITRPDGVLEVNEGWRTMPYLETGSVGIGFAIDAYLERREDERFREALTGIDKSARSTMYILSGVFTGRSGIALYLAHRRDPEVARQIQNLSWHAIPYGGGLAFPGTGLLRLSMDLATGTAGVLLAMGAARGDLDAPVQAPLLTLSKTPASTGAGR
jgi:serine/threonine protein kinase